MSPGISSTRYFIRELLSFAVVYKKLPHKATEIYIQVSYKIVSSKKKDPKNVVGILLNDPTIA